MSEEITNASGSTADPNQPKTIESAVDHAKRAFALKKYEQAVDYYASALELAVAEFGESHLRVADLYLLYGKALLENAISQNSVLGKQQEASEEAADDPAASSLGGPVLSFSGDAEDVEDDTVDLFANPPEDAEEDPNEDEQDEDEDDIAAEPEDDFNASWEVLDLARNIYEKQRDTGNAEQELLQKLADTYISLGDVSLETEKFDQAITDYEAGLALKADLHPFTSRHIAEAHYKLSIVLDLTPGRLSDSIHHAEKALQSVGERLEEMQRYIQSGEIDQRPEENPVDAKGKGKAPATFDLKDDTVRSMTRTQIENEIKDLDGLKEDLTLKVEELKTTPNESSKLSAPQLAQQALEKELNTASSSSTATVPVNDLTSMVVKKKKNQDASNGKRKAEAEAQPEAAKKARQDDQSEA